MTKMSDSNDSKVDPCNERPRPFYLPGGWPADEEWKDFQSTARKAMTDESTFWQDARVLAYFADPAGDGHLSKQELTQFRDKQTNKDVIDFSNFVLDNFDTVAGLTSHNFNQVADGKTKSMLQKFLCKSTPDGDISVRDFDVFREVTSDSMPVELSFEHDSAIQDDGVLGLFGIRSHYNAWQNVYGQYWDRRKKVDEMFKPNNQKTAT